MHNFIILKLNFSLLLSIEALNFSKPLWLSVYIYIVYISDTAFNKLC